MSVTEVDVNELHLCVLDFIFKFYAVTSDQLHYA